MTDTSDKAIEALRSDVMSQVGDDVQKMFDHEALFKRAAAMLLALQAERKAGWRRPVIPSDWATDTMKVAMKMLTIEVAKDWLFRDSMDSVEEDFARELGVIFSNGKGYYGISDIRGDERDDAHAILIDRALRGAIASLTPPTEAKP